MIPLFCTRAGRKGIIFLGDIGRDKNIIQEEGRRMGYRYETHLHTKEVSACGHTPAKDYIKF